MLLAKCDLLRYDLVSRTFKTTEKGLRFLEICNRLYDVMREEGPTIANPGGEAERI